MKRKITCLFLFLLSFAQTQAQLLVSDFEDLLLPIPPMGAFWNGSDQTGGFTSGGMYFNNSYDTSFGGYWASGFAYSSIVDSVTSGPANLYGAKPASGFGNSTNYGVVQQNAIARPSGLATYVIDGFYVTNGTYAYNSMRDGDVFARKFGDTTGTNSGIPQGSYPDFFKLTIKSYVGGALQPDSVEFYLADYRFSNDSLDYIVNTWEWVDCSSLQVFDSLLFILTSSDVGSFGMNTPAFFCIDNLTIDVTVGLESVAINNNQFKVFPNPAADLIFLKSSDTSTPNNVQILDINGSVVYESFEINLTQGISVKQLPAGLYNVSVQNNKGVFFNKFVKY